MDPQSRCREWPLQWNRIRSSRGCSMLRGIPCAPTTRSLPVKFLAVLNLPTHSACLLQLVGHPAKLDLNPNFNPGSATASDTVLLSFRCWSHLGRQSRSSQRLSLSRGCRSVCDKVLWRSVILPLLCCLFSSSSSFGLRQQSWNQQTNHSTTMGYEWGFSLWEPGHTEGRCPQPNWDVSLCVFLCVSLCLFLSVTLLHTPAKLVWGNFHK